MYLDNIINSAGIAVSLQNQCLSACFIYVFYSLFAADGGASKVIAVEASKKMAAYATQVIAFPNLNLLS